LATGQLVKGVILGVLGVTIVGSIDNFLRPAILSGRTQMNGLLMFISLLGGVSVFGLLGLVLGPLVTAMVIGLFEVYVRTSDIIGTARTNENTKLRNPHSPFNEHPEGTAAPR
jgi:predicted PurR-regulated permease PerM